MNIGNRPTVNGEYQTIEVHFFDFNKDLYNQKLTISLLYYLRDEEKFDSIDSLVHQLKKDEEAARDYIKKEKPL
jgi:riboflavin kinase/FMN adenylyltransferase